MIRPAILIFATLVLAATPAAARSKRSAEPETTDESEKPTASRSRAKTPKAETDEAEPETKGKGGRGRDAKSTEGKGKDAKGKPVQVGSFGDWSAFTAQSKGKTCYALAKPKDRVPASLKRDQAYIFISHRPGDKVRNEVSIIMGFPMKDNSEAKADIGGTTFDLIGKGANAWVKDPSEEKEFIETMRKGSKLVIKAAAIKGGVSTDSYSLAGLSEALARIQKDCP